MCRFRLPTLASTSTVQRARLPTLGHGMAWFTLFRLGRLPDPTRLFSSRLAVLRFARDRIYRVTFRKEITLS